MCDKSQGLPSGFLHLHSGGVVTQLVGAGVLHKFGGFSKEQDGNLESIMKTDQERKKAQGAGGGASESRCGVGENKEKSHLVQA